MVGNLIVGDPVADDQREASPDLSMDPQVDREFYIMQGELYTAQRHGSQGLQEFSLDKLLDERPEHLMFNGNMDALTQTHRMEAEVGDNVRIFFGVGGPNAPPASTLSARSSTMSTIRPR